MIAYAIKFQDGTYYAGYGKSNTTKLVYARLYDMRESAIFILRNMSEFHHCRDKAEIIEIEIHERKPKSKGYGTKCNVYIDEFFNWENEFLNG